MKNLLECCSVWMFLWIFTYFAKNESKCINIKCGILNWGEMECGWVVSC
jgi:hypothetical protein